MLYKPIRTMSHYKLQLYIYITSEAGLLCIYNVLKVFLFYLKLPMTLRSIMLILDPHSLHGIGTSICGWNGRYSIYATKTRAQ